MDANLNKALEKEVRSRFEELRHPINSNDLDAILWNIWEHIDDEVDTYIMETEGTV